MCGVVRVSGLSGADVNVWKHTLVLAYTAHTDSHTRHLRISGTDIQVTFLVSDVKTALQSVVTVTCVHLSHCCFQPIHSTLLVLMFICCDINIIHTSNRVAVSSRKLTG